MYALIVSCGNLPKRYPDQALLKFDRARTPACVRGHFIQLQFIRAAMRGLYHSIQTVQGRRDAVRGHLLCHGLAADAGDPPRAQTGA